MPAPGGPVADSTVQGGAQGFQISAQPLNLGGLLLAQTMPLCEL